ncbi:MAG: substrate-binding domain-containing protein [Sedimentisphaerales bacterium]|nr:substrate-binding domain-containing protein [Sedimentisphaerales bacterium]
MKKGNWLVYLILGISAVLFVSGLLKKESLYEKTIAVIPKGTASMWWEVVHSGANKAGEELGYAISWIGPEQETDREKQIQVVDDAITKKVMAIVLAPNDQKALARPVRKIKEEGIPCVIIDSAVDVNDEDYVSFVATDNFLGGADGARSLGKALSGKGTVILTKFVPNSASTDARAEGFKKTLETEFPDIKIIDEQYTQGTVEDARQKTIDMLVRNQNVNGIFAVNQPSSVGAYKALQSHGSAGKIKMVGFDSDPILIDGIAEGGVYALIVQNPFEIGYQGVIAAVAAIDGKEVPKKMPIPSMIVNKDNLEEMKQKFPAALGL